MPKVIIRNNTGRLVRWQPCFSRGDSDSDLIPDHSNAKLIEPGKTIKVPSEEYMASPQGHTHLPYQKFNVLIDDHFFTHGFIIAASIWAEDLKNAKEIVLTSSGGRILFSKKERRGCFLWFWK